MEFPPQPINICFIVLFCFFFYTVGTVLFDVGDVYYEDSTCAVFSESMRLKHVLDESYC